MSPERAALMLVPAILALGCPLPPLDFGERGRAETADELLRRLELSELAVRAVRGEGRLSVDGPDGKGSTGLFVEAVEPSQVHLELLDFFGRPQSVLAIDGDRFGFYDAQAARYLRGPASPENLARVLPVSLPVGELVAILLGRVPRLSAETSELTLDERRGLYLLKLRAARVTQRLEVEPRTTRILRSSVEGSGGYALALDDATPYAGGWFARRVRLEFPGQKVTLELRWQELTFNHHPDPALFEAEPPEGVPVIDLDPARP